jgi:hypothetical protein
MAKIEAQPLNSALGRLCKSLFPNYRGRLPVRVYVQEAVRVSDYWDGGSRTQTVFTRPDGSKSFSAAEMLKPENRQQAGNPYGVALGSIPLIPGVIAVEHHISCGKDRGFSVIVHPADVPKFLPAASAVII